MVVEGIRVWLSEVTFSDVFKDEPPRKHSPWDFCSDQERRPTTMRNRLSLDRRPC